MCGRYSLASPEAELAERFGAALPAGSPGPLAPRYNIAPSQQVLVVERSAAAHVASFCRWGLRAPWSRGGVAPINARCETAPERPLFRGPLRRQRCLVPADGFYEWRRTQAGRFPVRFTLSDGGVFALAGIWEVGPEDQCGRRPRTVAILTTRPNGLVAPVHDRMPVVVRREHEQLWLDPGVTDPGALAQVWEPYPAGAMRAYAVSQLVNNAANDSPACIRPVA